MAGSTIRAGLGRGKRGREGWPNGGSHSKVTDWCGAPSSGTTRRIVGLAIDDHVGYQALRTVTGISEAGNTRSPKLTGEKECGSIYQTSVNVRTMTAMNPSDHLRITGIVMNSFFLDRRSLDRLQEKPLDLRAMTAEAAARVLYHFIQETYRAGDERSLWSPQQAAKRGNGPFWRVSWEAGPVEWGVLLTLGESMWLTEWELSHDHRPEVVLQRGDGWYTEPHYRFDVGFITDLGEPERLLAGVQGDGRSHPRHRNRRGEQSESSLWGRRAIASRRYGPQRAGTP